MLNKVKTLLKWSFVEGNRLEKHEVVQAKDTQQGLEASSSRTVTVELSNNIGVRINVHNLEQMTSNSNGVNINGNKASMETDTNAIDEDNGGAANDLNSIGTQFETKLAILENWRKLKARKGKAKRKKLEMATKFAYDPRLIQTNSSIERERLVRKIWQTTQATSLRILNGNDK